MARKSQRLLEELLYAFFSLLKNIHRQKNPKQPESILHWEISFLSYAMQTSGKAVNMFA